MNFPILSICIPTYNRSKFLPDCLNSIVYQFNNEDIYNQIEVVISDNASTDNTAEIVQDFQKRYKNIIYFKNEENIGFDKNLLNVIDKSNGEYCLTIGDDDAFLPDSFSLILHKIETLELPYYMINSWGYDHDLIHPIMSHPNRQITKDIFYKNLSEFVHSIKNYTDLVGNFGGMTHIFRRELWQNFDKKEKYIGTQCVHLFIVLSIFKDTSCVILAEPIIKTRNDNMRWDTFPGLENHTKRVNLTTKTILWISDLYELKLSYCKVKTYMLIRVYWIFFKEIIKKILHMIGLRK